MAITKISPDLVDFDSALVVSPTLTIGDATAEDTKIVFDGNAQDYYIGLDDSADDLVIGLGSVVGSSPAISIDENINSTFAGTITANAGVVVDNITIDGTEIDLSSGDLTLDVAGDIILDADGGDINFKDGGTTYGFASKYNDDLWLGNSISDGDVTIRGNDGGSSISALTFDMSEGGAATFNGELIAPNGATEGYHIKQTGGTATPRITNDANNWTIIRPGASGSDVAINNYANSANLVTFTDEGNVGIGVTSVTHALEINRSSSSAAYAVVGNGGNVQSYIGVAGDNLPVLGSLTNHDLRLCTNATERMRIQSDGVVRIGAVAEQTMSILNARVSGAAIEFGHTNNTAGYFGTIGAFGSAGYPYIGFCTASEDSANTFSTFGHAGFLIRSNLSGALDFMSVATASATGQTPTNRFQIAANGDLTGTDTSIGSLSDLRLKENIENFTGGLDLISKLTPRTFTWKDETVGRKKGTRRGFIAQEVLEVDNYWITEEDASDKEDLEYDLTKDTEKRYVSKLTDKDALYVSALQEAIAKIETLEAKVKALEEA